jgi:hypothetical protein
VQFLSGIAQRVTRGTTNQKVRATSLTVGLLLIRLGTFDYLLFLPIAIGNAQADKSKRGSVVRIEPNHYSPDLYAESLDSKFTLINLPGASQSGSFWELEYEIYFVPEAAYQKTMRRLVGAVGSANPQASDFQEKILLRKGKFRVTRLNSIEDRTRLIGPIPFKSIVPDAQRTKAASLMTSYSVKIYDASLKKTIFDAGLWVTKPFEADTRQPETAIPRRTLYANFFVSPAGDLFKSQWARNGTDTTW